MHLKSLLKITTCLSIFGLLFLLATNSFLQQDDYCFKNDIASLSLLENLIYNYNVYDGRAFSPIYLLRPILVGYFSAEVNVIITTLALIGTAIFIASIFKYLLGIRDNIKVSNFALATIIVISLWIGMRAHIARTIYWPTSNYYTYVNLFLVFWFWLLFSMRSKIWILVPISLFLAMSGINLAPGTLVFFFLFYFFSDNPVTTNRKLSLLIFFSLIIGTLIVLLAPGNFQRAENTTAGIKLAPAFMVKSYFLVSLKYILMSKWILISATLTSFYIVFNYSLPDFNRFELFKKSIFFLCSAFATILPFSALPDAASKHTSAHFQLFLYISTVLLIIVLLKNFRIKPFLTLLIFYGYAIFFLFVGIEQYIIGLNVKKAVKEREQILVSKKGTTDTIYVPHIVVPDKLFTNRYYEYSNKEPWGLACLSYYYKTGPVRLK
jgi:hypothetical protein